MRGAQGDGLGAGKLGAQEGFAPRRRGDFACPGGEAEHIDKDAPRHDTAGWRRSGVEDEAEDPHRGSTRCNERQAAPVSGRLPRLVVYGRRNRNTQETQETRRESLTRARRRGPTIGGEFDPGSGSTLAACLMHASRTGGISVLSRGGRVRNTWAICPEEGDSFRKREVIPHELADRVGLVRKGRKPALGGACGRLASWWGHGSPRQRSVAGLRGWPATRGLRHGPDSYGRQQQGIFRNGRKPDGATPRAG